MPFRLDATRFVGQARELGERYHMQIDPSRPVWQLSVGEQQRVEILKTLQRGAQILILDEPTAVLTPQESEELMRTLRQIAAEGRTVILISHKLEEIRSVADRVSVLRGGSLVAGGLPIGEMSARDLARLMVGEPAALTLESSRAHATRRRSTMAVEQRRARAWRPGARGRLGARHPRPARPSREVDLRIARGRDPRHRRAWRATASASWRRSSPGLRRPTQRPDRPQRQGRHRAGAPRR